MKKMIGLFIAFSLTFVSLKGDNQISKDEMLSYVDSVKSLFQSRYAPGDWKNDFCQWNLNDEIKKIKIEIESKESISVKDFQRILTRFFRSTKDYHVGGYYFSTEVATLPFKAKRFGDRYYITYVDTSRLGVFQVGDELISFGGRDPDEIVQELKHLATPSATEESDQSIAECYLTARGAMIGLQVPRGAIVVSVKDKDTGEINSYQMIWTYTPEDIQDIMVAKPQNKPLPKWLDSERMKFERALPLPENYLSICCKDEEEAMTLDPNEIGAKKSFLPKLGHVIWETNNFQALHAYLYVDDEKRVIGYVRIPHFMLNLEELEEFEKIIEIMSENAEVLVIDQLNNPGGMLFATYSIASMLTDKPLETPKEHMLLSQEEIMEATIMLDFLGLIQSSDDAKALLGETFYGIPVNYQTVQFMKEYFRFMIDQWKEGKIYTDLTHMYGIDHVNPHPTIRFTKPIVMLINGLDFSCGDFFPAILKDNDRVTLVGTRTAGAGGYVLGHHIANRMGVATITVTGSLGIRSNGKPIENLGVSPHVLNELTPSDIQNGYQDYAQKINEVVSEKIEKGSL